MSFFGGDPNVAHFVVSIPDRYVLKLHERERRALVQADREKLKAAGEKTERYFQFRVTNKAGKAAAKIKADAEAARIEAATGIKMSVNEGCFL